VLNYENSGVEPFGDARHYVGKRFRAAGRCGDYNRGRRLVGGNRCSRHRSFGNWRRRNAHRLMHTHNRRGGKCPQELRPNNRKVDADRPRRLADEVNRTELERADGEQVIGRGSGRTQHDDGPRHLRHYLRERRDAVHSRHLYVERHDVGTKTPDFLHRFSAVASRSHHQEFRAGFDNFSDEAAHERAVIHYEHSL